MPKTVELGATIDSENLQQLVNIFSALGKISDIVRLKKENEHLLLYTLDGKDRQVHAFKYYILSFDDMFNDHKIDELDWIITDIKKLTKQLQFYLDYEQHITFTFFTIDGTDLGSTRYLVKQCFITNSIFESFIIGAEPFLIHSLSLSSIEDRADQQLRKFGFEVTLEDFLKVKKLIGLDTTHEVVEVEIKNEKVKLKEKKWALQVATTSAADQTITFRKKYISNAEEVDPVAIDIYDTYIILRGHTSTLMITLDIQEY